MNEKRQDSQTGGMSVGDIYFVLFRQKWKILTLSLAGIFGAVLLLFVVKPPQYQSDALISIRYVVEGKSLTPPGDESNTTPLDQSRNSVIADEINALNSLDLAKQVVQVMTPEKILPNAGTQGGSISNQADRAAFMVRNGLSVEPLPESSVIRLTYQNPDPALVQPVLGEIINAYLMRHVQLHQGSGVPNEFLTNEVARLRAQLAQTDDELRKLKNANGVVSADETQKAYADQISQIRLDIFSAQVELAEHQAMLEALGGPSGTDQRATNVQSSVQAPFDQVEKYRNVSALLLSLEQKEQNYLTVQGFTTENVLVKQVQQQIEQNEIVKKGLEEKYPALATLSIPLPGPASTQPGETPIDLRTESERVAALKVKIQTLNSQFGQVWTEATNFDKIRTSISELEQKRSLEATDLNYFAKNLDQAHMDEALGEDKAANISIIQYPTPPVKGWSKQFKKKVAIIGAGGVVAGLALAFFIEFFWDRSIKRPTDVENKLRLPLFVSIPDITRNGHRSVVTNKTPLLLKEAKGGERQTAGREPLPQEMGPDSGNRRHPLRRFYEGLRDRLVVYFEVKNLPHKPKLVGVTSCARGAGVSSIATGVAASLSETGEGNVLLVDMNVEGGAAQHFHKGKPNCGLDSALKAETRENALIRENLYVATESMRGEELPQVLPKRFAGLISKIRSSDYDYIIFDMPPVAETTATFRAARLMDMMLLVIEAEKTNQDVVQRVVSLLAESKANVSVVLNKTQTYVPTRLHQEFLHDL
ncbi:MAG TPA: Wzz/FepE/Etk N-terminal domain-containing protein [Verrucomicrobiae bacterium]|nr:Wzz/FepE/Etk N-terminal domain-containing protein [Verrucomicrobiae bacterium]